MLNYLSKGIVALLLLLSVGLIVFARESSPSFAKCEVQQQTGSAAQRQPEDLSHLLHRFVAFRCTGQFVSDNNAAITAVATVLLTFVTVGLVWIGYLQIATSRRQLRAYLSIGHGNLVNFDDANPVVQVLIKNSGQSPAYSVEAWNAVLLHQLPLRVQLTQPPNAEIIRAYLGPGMSFHLGTNLTNFPEAARDAIRAGRQAVFVFGNVDYRDAFGKRHFMRWRMFFGEDSARRPDGSLSVCPEGNEAN
jgi:hypothetical protein